MLAVGVLAGGGAATGVDEDGRGGEPGLVRRIGPGLLLLFIVGDILGTARIEDLPVPFQCVAAEIESSASRWFTAGPIASAVAASCGIRSVIRSRNRYLSSCFGVPASPEWT